MTIVLGKVANPRGEELSTGNGYRRVPWKSTCKQCIDRGHRFAEEDWISIRRERPVLGKKEYRSIEIDKFPERCRSCGTKAKRFTRMKHSLDKLVDIKRQLAPRGKFSKLKMITIGNNEALSREEFTKRFKKFRDKSSWLIGGTYVLEQGTNPQGDYDGMWHMHGVFIAPYMPKEMFDNQTVGSIPEEYGLGNMHYQEAKLEKNLRSRHLENYIAKYMCKDGNRKQSFGALYRCEMDWILDNEGAKVARLWTQPNAQKYKKIMNEWKN